MRILAAVYVRLKKPAQLGMYLIQNHANVCVKEGSLKTPFMNEF